jgi:metal-responsive CopG/Arc/MetJ family transcriptional regulator
MTKTRIGITISDQILKEIDQIRGLIPRSTYIDNLLVQHFKILAAYNSKGDGNELNKLLEK